MVAPFSAYWRAVIGGIILPVRVVNFLRRMLNSTALRSGAAARLGLACVQWR